MSSRVWWVLLLAATVGACTDSQSTATTLNLAPICRQLAIEVVDRAQEFVDRFADSTLADFPEGELPGLEELRAEIDAARADALGRGCADFGFEEMLAAEARSISGRGPIGRPLAASLRGEDPASGPPETVELGPDDDLAGTLYRLGGGSVVNLAAGTYDLDETLLVDRELTISGAGVGETIIQSTAREAAILIIQPGALTLSDVTVEHSGEALANVVVAAGNGLVLDSVRLSGAVADPEGEEGGHGLLLLAPEGSARSVVSDSQFVGNQRIGIAVFGSAALNVTGGDATRNGVCGICAFDEAGVSIEGTTIAANEVGLGGANTASLRIDGVDLTENSVVGVLLEGEATASVRHSTLEDNGGGLEASGSAWLTMRHTSLTGGEVGLIYREGARGNVSDNVISTVDIGLQIGDEAAPLVRFNAIESVVSAGVIYGGESGGVFASNRVTGSGQVAIQLGGAAMPTLSTNRIEGPGPVGVVYAEQSGGVLTGNTITGLGIGMQIAGTAAPEVTDNLFTDLEEYSIAVFADASGTISGNTCASGAPGIILVGGADPALTDNDCSVVRG